LNRFISNNFSVKSIVAPASKSVAQRVILASSLCQTQLQINHFGKSDDVLNIIEITRQLGAEIKKINKNTIRIQGKKHLPKLELNVGESGLGIRLTTPIASTFNQNFTINGKGSLLKRPLTQFKDFLPQMGVNIKFTNNHLPISIKGQLIGDNYTVDGGISSQYISGLLMALPLVKEDSILKVKFPTSLPYIDTTLSVLDFFNIKIINNNYQTYYIKGNQKYLPKAFDFTVEGDWSGASFWIVYGLISGSLSINNLNSNSTQADMAILEVVNLVGGHFLWQNNTLNVISNQLKHFEFDATNCPDLFPPLVTLAAAIKGVSKIRGVNRLKHKESNRALVLQKEFNKLGLDILIDGDIMLVNGTGRLSSGQINSNNDHRIAMCMAIASVLTPNGIEIMDSNCVNKSYPEFWDIFKKNI
jgi:3-phosphoshikimate 1-carboxyvinyltransferase